MSYFLKPFHSPFDASQLRARKLILPALALPALIALSGNASALTQGQCADAVVKSCNKAFPNNYQGRIACVDRGLDTCDTLAQSGGGGDNARPARRLTLRR